MVQGEGPGARYAHVLALVGQRFLLVLGGNDGYKVSPGAAPPQLRQLTPRPTASGRRLGT